MPNISFRQLSSYIKDLKKNNKSENAIFKLLIQQAEAFGGLLHDNHKLTTQDERQDIYGDIKEYLDAYDKAFGGDPKNAQENESLANINAIGERLSAKLNTIGTKPGNGHPLFTIHYSFIQAFHAIIQPFQGEHTNTRLE